MNIKSIIDKNGIKYKERKLKFLSYLIFENETMLVIINNNKNIFKIIRSDFEYIEQELLNYDFCLIDSSKKRLYYMKITEPNNFIRKAFDSTEKDEIYFGKEILQNEIAEIQLIEMISNIGK